MHEVSRAEKKVSNSRAQSLRTLWPAPRVYAQVQALPDLFQAAGVGRQSARRRKVELVIKRIERGPTVLRVPSDLVEAVTELNR